ncbi:MAG: hypothetical protein QGD90_00265 [Candidatus Hydrogenedentes bacterium]|nr:hypothetical protein [Candidatus Hydrogenedentota bacterium]
MPAGKEGRRLVTDKLHLRCSKLPLFNLCASSAIPVRNPIIEGVKDFNNPASLGTAVHEPLALLVMSDDADPDLSAMAADRNVDTDDLAQLYDYGKRCWPMLKEHFGEKPVVEESFEREFSTFILSGHPDMLSGPDMVVGVIGDWKSGRVEYDASWQLYGGSLGGGARRGVIVWLRETWTGQPFEVVEIPPEKEIVDRLTAQVAAMHKGECVTGPHCRTMYCPRQHECEAYREKLTNECTALVELDGNETLPALEIVARGYEAWKNYEALSKRFKDLMNEVLDTQGEIILPGGDKKLVRLTTHPKVFDARAILAVMDDYGVPEPASCFKVASTKLEKAVKDMAAGVGEKKGARYAAFLQDCETAGALRYVERKTRKEIRV